MAKLGWVALVGCVALCALVTLNHHGLGDRAMLLGGSAVQPTPFLDDDQSKQAENLFGLAAKHDSMLEGPEDQELAVIDKTLKHAQEKLEADQRREMRLKHKIHRANTNVNQARASYTVNIRNGVTTQAASGYRQQSWPRGFSAGKFDMPDEMSHEFHGNDISDDYAHRSGVGPVLEEISTLGRSKNLTPGQKLAQMYLLSSMGKRT